ncbi:MAG: ATP-binding protein [Planctomycetes bacterium]|nr:ATP-binding protein [Planctomycetota bacterium]
MAATRLSTSMEDLSLHVLDIVENSVAASARRIEIDVREDTGEDRLTLEIRDDGKGMDEETRRRALDPFFTTRTTRRVGLGLPLLAQAARESGGTFELISEPGRGTLVRATFLPSHPDCKPLGDMPQTLEMILAGKPDLDLRFEYTRDSEVLARFESLQAGESENGSTDN